MFSCEFCKILKGTYFTEHLQATTSASCTYYNIFTTNMRAAKVLDRTYKTSKIVYLELIHKGKKAYTMFSMYK